MRIGIITGEYPPMQGGIGAYSQILAHKLAGLGHEVFIFSSEGTHSPNIPLTTTGTWGIRCLPKIKQWAKSNRLDLLNIQFQTAAFQMSPYIHVLPDYISEKPLVTTFHDLRYPYLFPKAGRLRKRVVHHLARKSNGVIVTNHEDEVQISHLPQHTLIPIGSNIEAGIHESFDRAFWRQKAGADDTDFLLAHFGFVNHSKGLHILLDSISDLRSSGLPIKLVMIGGRTGSSDPTNANYVDSIDRHIEKRGLIDQVTWTGFVDDAEVAAYMQAADLLTLPFLDGASYRRGSLMAAIDLSCPIVTTRPAITIPEFVHGESMWFVAPDDTTQLASAIRDLFQSPDMRAKLQQGAKSLRHLFNWDTITGLYLEFFEQVIGAKD